MKPLKMSLRLVQMPQVTMSAVVRVSDGNFNVLEPYFILVLVHNVHCTFHTHDLVKKLAMPVNGFLDSCNCN